MAKVLVIGLARSGLAAIRMLHHLNEDITLNTFETLDKQTKMSLQPYHVTIIDGGHPLSLLNHDFDYVVKNPGVPMMLPIIVALKEKQIPILTEIELGYRMCPHLTYVAITGTNGKTTTTTLTYELLKKKNQDVYLAGNIGIPLCEVLLDQNLFKRQATIVLEIAGFQLLDTQTFRPNIAAILNLSPDHLDYFPDVASYYQSKCNIYQNMRDQDILFVNADDQTSNECIKFDGITMHVGYKKGDVCVQNETIMVRQTPVVALTHLHVVGKHNVYNAMFAVSIAYTLGVDCQTIAQVLNDFKGVEHRIEYVGTINGVPFYNDSKATNVDSVEVAVQAFKQPIILLLGGKDKGLDFTPLLAYQQIHQVICFGQAKERIATYFESPILVEDLTQAVAKAKTIAEPGQVVLLSPGCSSYDAFLNFEQRGRVFKELVLND